MPDKAKPIFHKRIFWDVVFENDIRNCRRYYGDEKVTTALLNAKFLPEVTMYLASAVIDRPLKDFRCYTLRQLNPGLFPY
jgi:hypothetical protein